MSQRHIIAILIAGLFVGAQVGLADVSESTYSDEQEYVEPAPIQAELEPAPIQAELEPAPAQPEPLDQLAVASLAEPSEIHAAPTVVSENVFPRSDGEYDMMPAVIAYLDRLEASRRAAGIQLGARGDVFPRSDGEYDMMPAVIAYLDRREATRLAAARNTMSGSSEFSLASAGE